MAIALEPTYVLDQSAVEEPRRGKPFTFTGRAGEYFGIWIVNLLLPIITLGIYSAWAKVRTKRYFYGNTKLDGSSFDYLASPIQILKGRLIVFAFFAVYAVVTTIWPITLWAFIVLMFLITPWAVVRARVFNAHYSAFRNVRFGFDGGLGEAFRIYILLPIASMFTLGAVAPYAACRSDRFLIDRSSYGKTSMSFGGEPGAYFRIYGTAFLIGLPAVILLGYVFVFIVLAITRTIGLDQAEAERAIGELIIHYSTPLFRYKVWLPYVIGIAVVLGVVASSYLTTYRQNYLVNNSKIGPHELRLNLSLSRILWIRFSNLVVIALSFGLMMPWATIRMTRYKVEQMRLVPSGDLATMVNDEQEQVRALGDELGEGMDLDIGLGV